MRVSASSSQRAARRRLVVPLAARCWLLAVAVAAAALADDVIVEFRDDAVSAASVHSNALRLRQLGDVRREYSRVFHGAAMSVPAGAVRALEQLPFVLRVHPDREMFAMAGAATDQIRAAQVWSTFGTRGKGIVVAVIDTGVDYNHEALGRGFGPGFKVIGGYDFANHDADPMDDNGHGTHVAGIVAGDSLAITGVAPQASLMAFKVLRSTGSGKESDVIAAIEVATDPNGDNDTSDHVDVINLSLGSRSCEGSPDDAGSRAIDAAVRAGVVVAVAAGNEAGKYHCISSPGLARTAITVGAVDFADHVAAFSSRGPAQKDLTMKPEVSAPGVGITSSLPGQRYGAASGTSMATPHVAGAAALLKALHKDWTPAQIKAALMINSAATDQPDAMTIGSGRIDVFRAAGTKLAVDKPSLDFGLDPVTQGKWTQSRTLRVTNTGTAAATWTATSAAMPGIAVSVSPGSLPLAAGAGADVTLSIDVDNSVAQVGPKSFSGGGALALAGGGETVLVPWTFVKAVRATGVWEKDEARFVFMDAGHTTTYEPAQLTASSAEVLLASSGLYDVFVFGSTYASGALTRATFLHLEAAVLNGDTTLSTTEAQGDHVVRGATTTVDGQPMRNGADQTYALSGRLVFAGAPAIPSVDIPALPLRELHVNTIRDRHSLVMNETYVDFIGNAVYAIEHPAVKGVGGDVTLAATSLKAADVQLLLPAGAVSPRVTVRADPAAVSVAHASDPVWNGRLYLSPNVDVSFAAMAGENVTLFQAPALRLTDGQIAANATSVPWWYSGTRFVFGGGPRFASASFTNVTSILKPVMSVDLFGALGEAYMNDRALTTVSTYGSDGKLRAQLTRYPTPMDFSLKTKYTVEAISDATAFPDLPVRTTLTMTLDSSRADYIPPAVTTLFILDAAGRALHGVPPHGAASLYFSAADYDTTPVKTYVPVQASATKAWYRYAGAAAWTPLTLTQAGEDAGTEGRLGTGLLFRADLTQAANVNWARVELKIEVADVAGNGTTLIMAPAFSVGGEYPPRRRAAR